MKNTNLFTATKTTVRANAYVPFPTLEVTRKTAPNVKPTKQKNGFYKWTFDNAEIAKTRADEWNAAYTTACNAKPAPVSAPTPAKGKAKTITVTDENGNKYTVKATDLTPVEAPVKAEPRTRKPKASKGVSVPAKLKADLDKLAHTNDNSKAHAVMVAHGYTNSNSAEYQAIWKGYWHTIRK